MEGEAGVEVAVVRDLAAVVAVAVVVVVARWELTVASHCSRASVCHVVTPVGCNDPCSGGICARRWAPDQNCDLLFLLSSAKTNRCTI